MGFLDPSGHQRQSGFYIIRDTYQWYADPDASEFGKWSDTYKIIDDTSRRWGATDNQDARNQLQGIAEDARRLARSESPYMYGTDRIMNTLHANAEQAKLVSSEFLRIAVAMGSYTDFLAMQVGYLIGMTNKGPWDYKLQEAWRVPIDYQHFNNEDTSAENFRNWYPWIYFEGQIIGADKVGNINMAYVGKKMKLPEFVYQNFATTDKDDGPWVQYGIDLAKKGR